MTSMSKHSPAMPDEKKPKYLSRFRKSVQAIFKHDKTKTDQTKDVIYEVNSDIAPTKTPIIVTPVSTLLENLKKKKDEMQELENALSRFEIEPTLPKESEFEEVTIKIGVTEAKNVSAPPKTFKYNISLLDEAEIAEVTIKTSTAEARNGSLSSTDSGFTEKEFEGEGDEKTELVDDKDDDEVAVAFQGLYLDDDDGDDEDYRKDKIPSAVRVNRGPIRNKYEYINVGPYHHVSNQVNPQFLSGGTVIVKNRYDDDLPLPITSTDHSILPNLSPHENLQKTVEELIEHRSFDDNDLLNLQEMANCFGDIGARDCLMENPIWSDGEAPNLMEDLNTLLTPPMSNETVFSPISNSPHSPNQSFYSSPHANESFSRISPVSNRFPSPMKSGDEETFGFEDHIPSCVLSEDEQSKPRERIKSNSSVTMKQYKDMQNEMVLDFAKMDCCKDVKDEGLKGYFMKLNLNKRKGMCIAVANMSVEAACGVLHKVISCLSASEEDQDMNYALFGVICEKILSEQPGLFLENFGLNLLTAAALRCPTQPVLTRHLVQHIGHALRSRPDVKQPVFTQTDMRGDTLVHACARRGDAGSAVLAELTRTDAQTGALFDIQHVNSDGDTALHIACKLHGGAVQCLHTVHVLLAHGQADLWKGDIKGGETAVHLAVNAVNCDLQLVMLLFKHVDRNMWKRLAHAPNRSSVTPLEYARSATKSAIRQNYPQEVLSFLKKCR